VLAAGNVPWRLESGRLLQLIDVDAERSEIVRQ
jgi:hypothetical protein